MPDLDIIDRSVPRGWRGAMRVLVGNGSPEEVAHRTKLALTRSLRENGGLPGLEELENLVRARVQGSIDPHSAHVLLDGYEHRYGHQRHAKVAARVARGMLSELNQGRPLRVPVRTAITRRFVEQLVLHNLFGRVRPELGKHFSGWERAHRREGECLRALSDALDNIATQLEVDPTARNLRAPRAHRGFRKRTSELLHAPIM